MKELVDKCGCVLERNKNGLHMVDCSLHSAAPELLEEHKHWAKIQGRIIVEALQGEFEYLKVIAQTTQIDYINGEPYLKSEAITKAERGMK